MFWSLMLLEIKHLTTKKTVCQIRSPREMYIMKLQNWTLQLVQRFRVNTSSFLPFNFVSMFWQVSFQESDC